MKKNNDRLSGSSAHYTPELLIKNAAREIGFSLVGITDVHPTSRSNSVFDRWVREGRHGDMHYLPRGAEKRHDPARLLDGAKSVICVAANYYTKRGENLNDRAAESGRGMVAIYAQGRDYHEVMRELLRVLERRLKEFFPRFEAVAVVDTEPISERDLAVKSGIAWLGKNTCVISPEYGSWIFLGELITNLSLKNDEPLQSSCGSCTLCVDACPTGALDEAYIIDARKCISYLTIEKRGEIPDRFHRAIGRNVFGCDECQRVCPFNGSAKAIPLPERKQGTSCFPIIVALSGSTPRFPPTRKRRPLEPVVSCARFTT